MGNRTQLKTVNGMPFGELEDNGDEIIIYDMTGMSYGRYSKSRDETMTPNGIPVGFGNLLVTLLPR